MNPWWKQTNSAELAQGDLLPDCLLPIFIEEPLHNQDDEPVELDVLRARLIIVSQSCDLENGKLEFVALCPIHKLSEFEEISPDFKKKGRWESVRKGREPALHMVASPDNPDDNQNALVVDFGHIVSLPFAYLISHAKSLETRWQLQSPFLEHFSQAFARFFMRVGLPSSIPPFK